MNATENNNRLAQIPQAKELRVVHDDGPLSYLLDTARFEHLYRIAGILARSALTPKHLKAATQEETTANCFRVVNQAMRWGFDPFAVADESYVVGMKLAYQGKLAAAVVNSRAGLKGPLYATYAGAEKTPQRTVEISGTFKDEDRPRTIKVCVADVKTDNKLWTTNPDQKLFYTGATMWARRHCPEILLGVLTDHDLEMMSERTGGFEGDTANVARAEAKLTDVAKETPEAEVAMVEVKAEEPKPEPRRSQPAKVDQAVGASEMQLASIRSEVQRTGLSEKNVNDLLKQVGAKSVAKLTGEQAERILLDLGELADVREPGSDDE